MKTLFSLSFLLLSLGLFAQSKPPIRIKRDIRYKILSADSIQLTLNRGYDLIEDSCGEIIRTAHFNASTKKLFGKFKDINKNNSAQLISEGNYSMAGLKEGIFTCYYFNGVLQSKGQFSNDKPVGHWEVFYETGKPEIIFDSENGVVKISDEWDAAGKKIVDEGKGTHISNIGYVSWKGKLENGVPDGTWHSFKTDDANQIDLSTEKFKKGEFQKGTALGTDYTDASRINLVPETLFPYTEAEKFQVSKVNCSGMGYRHIIGARFSNGLDSYSEYIKSAIHPITSRVNAEYDAVLVIYGKVSKEGILINLNSNNASAAELTSRLSAALRGLPPLNPATVDGKPVEQGFEIVFTFKKGLTQYSYRFIPIRQADVQGLN